MSKAVTLILSGAVSERCAVLVATDMAATTSGRLRMDAKMLPEPR